MKSMADRFRTWYEYERDCNAKTLAMLESVPQERRKRSRVPKGHRQDGPFGSSPSGAGCTDWINFPEAPPPFLQGTALADLPRLVADTEAAWVAYLARLEDAELTRNSRQVSNLPPVDDIAGTLREC